jgi:hypothetical protein
LKALPVHIERLEGREAFAADEQDRSISLLEAASAGFAGLSARWELARTDLFLSQALHAAGRVDDARERLAGAAKVFEDLGSLLEIERSRRLSERLG